MALCRCLNAHAWPKGRTTQYVAYVHPVGYPKTALICDLCANPGVIGIYSDELSQYQNGQHIFSGPNNFTKMMADDAGAVSAAGTIQRNNKLWTNQNKCYRWAYTSTSAVVPT